MCPEDHTKRSHKEITQRVQDFCTVLYMHVIQCNCSTSDELGRTNCQFNSVRLIYNDHKTNSFSIDFGNTCLE